MAYMGASPGIKKKKNGQRRGQSQDGQVPQRCPCLFPRAMLLGNPLEQSFRLLGRGPLVADRSFRRLLPASVPGFAALSTARHLSFNRKLELVSSVKFQLKTRGDCLPPPSLPAGPASSFPAQVSCARCTRTHLVLAV